MPANPGVRSGRLRDEEMRLDDGTVGSTWGGGTTKPGARLAGAGTAGGICTPRGSGENASGLE